MMLSPPHTGGTPVQAICKRWDPLQQDACQLQGQQVYQVAAALQTLVTQLVW